jgi:protein-disulfide isomerase
MGTTRKSQAARDEPAKHIDRRHLLGGAAAAALLAAGGIGYYAWNRAGAAVAQPSAGADVSMAELLLPGPLGDHVMGAADAPVTIVEYASMTCPHCANFHETTYPAMKKKYVDTGKVRFIFREFPLDPLAAAASMLARCAGKDKYFSMIETLFAQQKAWAVQKPLQPLFAIAQQAGFTQQRFDECLANQEVLSGIEESRKRATEKFKVSSTPTFFINGKLFRGVLTMDELDKQVAAYL